MCCGRSGESNYRSPFSEELPGPPEAPPLQVGASTPLLNATNAFSGPLLYYSALTMFYYCNLCINSEFLR